MGSAVDEGRNPYGKPGKGNYDKAWELFKDIPCSVCGATNKKIVVNDSRIKIWCYDPGHLVDKPERCREILDA